MSGFQNIYLSVINREYVVWAFKVRKEFAEAFKRKIIKNKLLNSAWEIKEEGEYIIFPLQKKISGAIDIPLKPRAGKTSPYVKIFKAAEKEGIKADLPEFWEKIGDIVILPDFKVSDRLKEKVGELYGRILGAKTVAIYCGVHGEFREQNVEVIWGKDTETVHTENGIKYMLDISKLMFSSGNVNERIRMSTVAKSNEIVIDMFAGIGYFSLPFATSAKKVYACEKNPVAFYYLLKNIEINKFHNVVPIFGDNRKVCPLNMADRVVMGYFNTEKFLDAAFKILKDGGGYIHYHDLLRENDNAIISKIKHLAREHAYMVGDIKKRIVKSYAPRVWHVVFDLKVSRVDGA